MLFVVVVAAATVLRCVYTSLFSLHHSHFVSILCLFIFLFSCIRRPQQIFFLPLSFSLSLFITRLFCLFNLILIFFSYFYFTFWFQSEKLKRWRRNKIQKFHHDAIFLWLIYSLFLHFDDFCHSNEPLLFHESKQKHSENWRLESTKFNKQHRKG